MATASWGADEDEGDVLYTDDAQQPLNEFLCSHPLPQTVSVTRGSFLSQDAVVARGDVLLLRAMAPASVSLAFADPKAPGRSGARCELEVSPDIPVQFLVLPPKGDSSLSLSDIDCDGDEDESGEGGGGSSRRRRNRPVSIVTYPTVADLLLDSPTYFQANATYDDPYLPGFSVKPGDKFRYVGVVRDVGGDRQERLQCRTEEGEKVCLSKLCRGNFSVLKDSTPYTLRELIGLACVPRRLKVLTPQNQDDFTAGVGDSAVHANTPEDVSKTLLSVTGAVEMSRPEDKLQASPLDRPDTNWFLPLRSNLHVRHYSEAEYEEPVTRRKISPEPLTSFVGEHEHKLPVHAILFSYTRPPDIISRCLQDSRDIVVHEVLHSPKLCVKDTKKDEFFAISETVDISLVEIPRNLSSVFEMMSLPLGTLVQVVADVAADFPEPFILRYGDVLRVTKHECSSWKVKHSSLLDIPIVKCQLVGPNGKGHKLKLPLDLDVNLVVMTDPSQLKVTKVLDIFSGKEPLPEGNVSVLEGQGGSYPPLPSSIEVLELLRENELLVSPLTTAGAISPLVKKSVRIPFRHKLILGLKRKLEFPEGYFIMPSQQETVCEGIERIEESEFEELVQARKVATEYEDVEIKVAHRGQDEDARSQASSSGRGRNSVHHTNSSGSDSLSRSVSTGNLERKRRKDRVRRISQALNPKNWRLHRGTGSAVSSASGSAVAGEGECAEGASAPGIIALALQPHHATPNVYTGDVPLGACGDGPSTFHRHSQVADNESSGDDPYEDVNISHDFLARSGSLQCDQSDLHSSMAAEKEKKHLSASTGDIHKDSRVHISASAEETVRLLLSTGKEDASPTRSKKDNFETSPTRRRRKQPNTDANWSGQDETGRQRQSPAPVQGDDRQDKSEIGSQSGQDLEKAPPLHHARTRSPDFCKASERTPSAMLLDSSETKEKSSKQQSGILTEKQKRGDSTEKQNSGNLTETPTRPERRRRNRHMTEEGSGSAQAVDKELGQTKGKSKTLPYEKLWNDRQPNRSSPSSTPEMSRKNRARNYSPEKSKTTPEKSENKILSETSQLTPGRIQRVHSPFLKPSDFLTKHSHFSKRTIDSEAKAACSLQQKGEEKTKISPASDLSSKMMSSPPTRPSQSPATKQVTDKSHKSPFLPTDESKHKSGRTKDSPVQSPAGKEISAERVERQPKDLPDLADNSERKAKDSSDMADPARPRRPRRKHDKEKADDTSAPSVAITGKGASEPHSGLQSEHAATAKKAERVSRGHHSGRHKPPLPPKPKVLQDRSKTLPERVTVGGQPATPPRQRASRIGSTEAEAPSTAKPTRILGRRGTP